MADTWIDPHAAESAQIARRLAMARALQQQSMEPIESPNVPGASVSVTQGLAKLAQALVGGIQAKRAANEETKLQDIRKGERSGDLNAITAALTGLNNAQQGYVPDRAQYIPGQEGVGAVPSMPAGTANIPGMGSQQQVNSAAQNVMQLLAQMRSPEMQQWALSQAAAVFGQLREQQQQAFDNSIKQQQLAVSQGTLANAQATQQANEKRYQASNLSALAKQGLKIDDTGQIVAQDDSELSPLLKQQIADKKSLEEFRTADAEYKRAAAELDRAKADPNSPMAQQAAANFELSKQRLQIAQGNLVQRTNQNEFNMYGTVGGVAPAGTPTLPDGTPIGARNARFSQPTTQQINAAGAAQMITGKIPDVISNIDQLAPRLGPIEGRWNEFMQGRIGSDDPEFAALRANLTMLASQVALAHAQGRLPENLRQEFDHMINAPKQTASNLKAVIGKVDSWMRDREQLGQRNYVGRQQQGTAQQSAPRVIRFDSQGNILR